MTKLIVLILTIAAAVPMLEGVPNCEESCYEKCFRTLGTENAEYKEVYDNIMEIGLELNYLKNMYDISRVGFLLDSAVSSKLQDTVVVNGNSMTTAEFIFDFQKLLLVTLSLMIHGQKNYLVQYNEESAWTCDGFSCMPNDDCQVPLSLLFSSSIEINTNSHCPGRVEAACQLLHHQMTNLTCDSDNSNAMVVAITNGNFYINNPYRHRRSYDRGEYSGELSACPSYQWNAAFNRDSSSSSSEEFDFFSPCHNLFDTRYVVGTHSASRDIMELFPSKHGHYRFVQDSLFTYEALVKLNGCALASDGCCSGAFGVLPFEQCLKTQGPFGEIINDFPDHPAL